MTTLIAFFIPTLSLFIYLVLTSLECGFAFFNFFPKLLGDKKEVLRFINPIWESFNVFLVFAFVSFITFFPGAIGQFSLGLFSALLVFLILTIIKASVVLILFYTDVRTRIVDFIFLITAFLAPVLLMGALVSFMLTGNFSWQLWHEPIVWMIMVFILAAIFAIFSSFFEMISVRSSLSTISTGIFALVSAWLYSALLSAVPHLNRASTTNWIYMTDYLVIIFVLAIADILQLKRLRLIAVIGLLSIVFFRVWALAVPYLIYGHATLFEAVAAAATLHLMLIAFCVGFCLVAPSLVLLYILFRN